jgi:hypothetical protein
VIISTTSALTHKSLYDLSLLLDDMALSVIIKIQRHESHMTY